MRSLRNHPRVLIATLALALIATVTTIIGLSVSAQRRSGTTLAASKTIDICDLGDGNWKYSGDISVWNEGAVATTGLTIQDCIQNKTGSGQFMDIYCTDIPVSAQIPAGTTMLTATVFHYEIIAPALTGDIRNAVKVTITNHSGSLGTPKGPEPKATWTGGTPGPCAVECGCTYTQGYWGNKPGVVWPAPYDRNAPFFNSGLTWQQILDAPAGGNGYIILGKQYIAAALNQANNACTPEGLFGAGGTFTLATSFFNSASTPGTTCPTPSSCGTQKTWGGILDSYNNGVYPGGPAHCGE